MNLFDILALGIIALSTLMGLYKGLIKLSIGLVISILSLVCAYLLFPVVEAAIMEHIKNDVALNITSGITSYLISMIFFAFLGRQAVSMVDGISGGLVDRFLGLGAGIFRGLVICSLLFGMVAIFTSDAHIDSKTAKEVAEKIDSSKYPKWLTSSSTYKIIEYTSKIIGGMIPNSFLEDIKLPIPEKKLPEITNEVIDKAAGAAAQKLIEHATSQHSLNNDSTTKKSEPQLEHHNEIKAEDTLDSALKELME